VNRSSGDTLRGARILVTRPEEDAAPLVEAIRRLGGWTCCAPMIRILPPEDPADLERARRELDRYDWLAFTSRHAVEALLDGLAVPHPRRPRIAAVGQATAEAVRARGWPLDLTASGRGARALAEALVEAGAVLDQRILYPCSDRAGDALCRTLEAAGATVDRVVAYRTAGPDEATANRLLREAPEGFDLVVFASPSAVEGFLEGPWRELAREATAVAIGETTAHAVTARLGAEPVVSRSPDTPGLLDAVVRAWGKKRGRRS
jgi:uroporphyrinogen-III synthase